MTSEYPVLSGLLGRYFHEGWPEHVSSRLVIDRMIEQTPRDTLRLAFRELDRLLASGVCEPQLTDVLQFELGCHIAPGDEGIDASTWLMQLRRVMSEAV
jgi:CdiI immunity protein